MGKSGGNVRVSEYSMSMHVGICAAGSTLRLLNVKVGDKLAWRGNMLLNDVVDIDKPELFGGNKKEGGIRGLLWWLPGDRAQSLPTALAFRLGLAKEQCPGFRGLASIFFTGRNNIPMTAADRSRWPRYYGSTVVTPDPNSVFGNGANSPKKQEAAAKGFYWCANNPYMKTISARVRRAPEGLNPSIALIRVKDAAGGIPQYGANPAHIIFECMTNGDWGMGESLGAMDIGAFEAAAQTLYAEAFAMNLIWTRQSKIEDFIKDVLDHIQGALFVHPATGKHTLKLLRADYVYADLPIANEDNAKLTNFKRKTWAEVANEITVTWTNPESGEEETVTVQDNAAIAMQGGVSPDSRNYHAIARQSLAIKVAERDLAAVVHPIATCEAEVSRAFWETVTFDVIRLSWAKYGIIDAAFRVSDVTAGYDSNTVKLTLYEDVFGRARAQYETEIDTGWVDESTDPTPLSRLKLGTAPAFLTAAALQLNDPSEILYPSAISMIVAGQTHTDISGYFLKNYGLDVNGNPQEIDLGQQDVVPFWLSTVALPQEASTSVLEFTGIVGSNPAVGSFLLIGDGSDETCEIAVVASYDYATGWTLNRGVLDTVPRSWPIGTPVFCVPLLSSAADATERALGEVVQYRMQTVTSRGALDLDLAPLETVTISNRPHLPLRPANVTVGGVAFGTYATTLAASVPVAWANRNRVTEASKVLAWTAGSVTGEAAQSTVIVLETTGGAVITEITGIVGTSYSILPADFAGATEAYVKVYAERGGMRSLQAHSIRVTRS